MKKIMVVDDNTQITELMKIILHSEGYEVITINRGWDAIKRLEKESVDLVFLDLMMPGLDGMKTFEKIRMTPNGRKLKVIFLTAIDLSGGEEKKLIKLGNVSGYLHKPCTKSTILKAIKKASRKWF